MIVFTRACARDFRALLGRCVSGRPRGPAPPVILRLKDGVRTLTATTPEGVILTHTAQAACEPGAPGERDDVMVLPAAALAEVEDGTDEPVRVERRSKSRAEVRWSSQDQPRSLPVELMPPGRYHEVPDAPPLAAAPATFLTALHECGRTAARQSGRFALSKIQIQGQAGRVIGTDGKCALLWHGFTLPFPQTLLVPAVPVFGSKELVRGVGVRIGRTTAHLVLAGGPWAVWLPIDATSRYPDVAVIISRTNGASVAGIDERDAQALLAELPQLPGAAEEYRAVTLDLDGGVNVRAADAATGAVREVYLARSPVAGSPVRVALDRAILKRILTLGCHTIRVVEVKPIVAEGANRTILAATLDSAAAVPPAEQAVRTATDDALAPTEPHHLERRTVMKPPLIHGHGPNGQHDPPPDESADPLIAAEELRVALADVMSKATRLVAALRHAKKEKKALANVWAGLKSLNLGSGGV